MSWPNLFLVGAPRCGTTTVHELLGAHPDIFMSPNKEPWFFALEGVAQPFTGPGDGQGIRDRSVYRGLFDGAGPAPIVGESSTLYLASRRAPDAISSEIPDAKILVLLRNPVERAFSNFSQHRWQGREDMSFEAALAEGPKRVERGWAPFWDYEAMSRYGEQLSRWFDRFPAEQIRVITFDDLIHDRDRVVADLHRFLGVSVVPIPPERGPINAAGVPRWSRLHGFLRGSSRAKRLLRSAVPGAIRTPLRAGIDRRNRETAEKPAPEIAARLAAGFVEEMELVERLTGSTLPPWLD